MLPDNSEESVPPTPPQAYFLSERDWEAFMAALEHPPKPNAALKGLMEEFGPWEDSAPIRTRKKA